MTGPVLILGCGYLGRRVAAAWRDAGHLVHALTRSASRAEEFRAAGISPIVGDILDPLSLRQLPSVDTLLYAVGFDRQSGRTQREIACDGLANVLGEMSPRVGRFLFISSSSVYGQTGGEWVDEESPCEPARENGKICLDAEQLVRRAMDKGLDARILRLSGIYGPGRLLQRVESLRQQTPIGGNPEAWLNLIHVDDAARGVLACEERGRAGRTYLVSDDRPLQRREYYERLANLVGAPAPRFEAGERIPSPSLSSSTPAAGSRREPRSGDDFNKRCRNDRIKQELKLALRYPTVEEGLPASLSRPEA